jgi:hypothetical protein
MEQDSAELPQLYRDKMRADLGPFWELLPPEAVEHDAYAFLKKSEAAPSQDGSGNRRGSSEPATNTIHTEALTANK